MYELLDKAPESEFDRILNECLTVDNFTEMPYLTNVYLEALRINAPIANSSFLHLKSDATAGGINFRANDEIMINYHGLHCNSQQWVKPYEFIPERFDMDSEYSKDADGKARSPFSWMPFGGGHRICIGKTFTDFIMKSCLTLVT